jgi:GNAT superfamily N-acetyltransferase
MSERDTSLAPAPRIVVRPAVPDDAPVILQLIRELAEYERSLDQVQATEAHIRRPLFAESPAAFCHIAESDGEVAGFALWFLNYSTWEGDHGIYLEDLFVRPQLRGSGAGKALLRQLAQICAERGYTRLQWWVLDWNASAIGFYESIGAKQMDEWTVMRVSGDALKALAKTQT